MKLTKAVGDIVAARYGPEMCFSDKDALAIAEPLGRIISRYSGMTERVREMSDPVLLAGGIAAVAWPRVMRIMLGRTMQAPVPQPIPEPTREVVFSETRTMREEVPIPREPVNKDALYRTLRRMQSVP